MRKIKLEMIVERGENNLSGRVIYNDNLIVDSGDNVNELEAKLKLLLFEFEGLDSKSVVFEHLYDIYSLFQQFDFLNIGKVAERAGINAGLLRQYASQVKYPSAKQAQKIEDTIHKLADDMGKALIYA